MNSLSEAMATNTRIICIPFFGDQPENAKRLFDSHLTPTVLHPHLFTSTNFTYVILNTLIVDNHININKDKCIYNNNNIINELCTNNINSNSNSNNNINFMKLKDVKRIGEIIRHEGGLEKAIDIIKFHLKYHDLLSDQYLY